jgi:hypothetical protein
VSDYKAIGDVSTTLQRLLHDRMQLPSDVDRDRFQVTIGLPPPDPEDEDTEEARVNLFLFRVERNADLSNQEMPGRGSPGSYGKPPLQLDLYYLVTAYGATREDYGVSAALAHYVLGSAMRVLHDYPIVTDALVTVNDDPGTPVLEPGLTKQFEKIKITLENASLEDISKLWTALTRAFRTSAVYKVSVVQIESRLVRSYPRPVGEPDAMGPRVHVAPLARPEIVELAARRPDDEEGSERSIAYLRIGDTLIIEGSGFSEDSTVYVEDVDVTGEITSLAPDRIELTLPDDDDLQPGPLVVKIVNAVSTLPQTGFPSNLAVFMLVPRVDLAVIAPVPPLKAVTITGSRLFSASADSLVIVNDEVIRSDDYVLGTPSQIIVELSARPPAGSYAVRVRVNGVENVEGATLDVPL